MLYKELKDYFVNDLIYDDTKIIFVLESPHTQEVKNGYPVAGKSGVDMSNVLFDLDEAFGKLVYEKKLNGIGIANIFNYPLQLVVYDEILNNEMNYFEKIRQNPKLRKRENPINSVINKMMSDFKSRLSPYKDKKIVLCGNFASSAFESIFSDADFKEVLHVPHPSFNNWKKAKYKDSIEKLKEFVK
jgi:uracil-DNA glycosylase